MCVGGVGCVCVCVCRVCVGGVCGWGGVGVGVCAWGGRGWGGCVCVCVCVGGDGRSWGRAPCTSSIDPAWNASLMLHLARATRVESAELNCILYTHLIDSPPHAGYSARFADQSHLADRPRGPGGTVRTARTTRYVWHGITASLSGGTNTMALHS